VTRPIAQASSLVERLERLGHEAVVCPLISLEPLGHEPIDLAPYDWVVLTSANGAEELARRRAGRLPRVAAIGPGTAAALRRHGIAVDLVPAVSTQEGLVAAFPPSPGLVLVAAAEQARPYLARMLGAEFVALYRTVEIVPEEAPDGDLALLTSASAARVFASLRTGIPAVSIGPETTKAARLGGVPVLAEAQTHDLDGLVAALEQARRAEQG